MCARRKIVKVHVTKLPLNSVNSPFTVLYVGHIGAMVRPAVELANAREAGRCSQLAHRCTKILLVASWSV